MEPGGVRPAPETVADEIAHEQGVVDVLYARLDELRTQAASRLAEVLRSRAGGNAQNQSERDSLATTYEARVARLSAVEARLAFGRLDLRDDETRYIGRIGLSDDDQRQLLLDWRARAAEPFYQATAAAAGDVVRRRHLALHERRVTGVEDELLDLERAGRADGLVLNGEGALMAALGEHRTGRMRDIVSTIQAEQDSIIRSPMAGVLVVQGGPGTGKTAVALHRAAYLLYTYRERARSGVLVVGPSRVFLRYIEQVLPSLGETGVVMTTPGRLFPGVDATASEDPRAARLKGELRMLRVLRRAVAARQRVPSAPRPLLVDGTRIELAPTAVAQARARARRSPRPHNAARAGFVGDVLLELAQALAAARGRAFDPEECEDMLADLRESPDVRREVNLCWMPLTPQRLLGELWADPVALAAAAPYLSADDRRRLSRPREAPWTAADVPLLDELAELLGEDDAAARAARRRAAAERGAELAYARETLDVVGAGGLVAAEVLADRFAEAHEVPSVAERAAGDRRWVYAHVVVDEAQELSPMTWRLLVRRCPSRSMTVVGDPAQTASEAGAGSWAEALDRNAPGRWRLAELTVSYRTPAEVLAVASDVLAAAGITVRAPRSARSGEPPSAVRATRIGPGDDTGALAEVVKTELQALGEGRLAVVVPRHGYQPLAERLAGSLPPGAVGADLTSPVTVLDVEQVKGLEFDTVVLVEPAAVLEQSRRGANDLYVALTRPTHRLVVVHAHPLPPGMGAVNRSDVTVRVVENPAGTGP